MKDLEAKLKAQHITPTAMRLLVLDLLVQQATAQSLTELEIQMDRTDRVTLYRTIRTFEENGLVHRIEDGSGVTKFALCAPGCDVEGHHDLHVHFYCNNCKQTHCLPKTMIPEVSLPAGYLPTATQLIMKGTCKSCNS